MKHCSNFKGPGKNGQFIVLTCKTPISGRYVKILRSGKGFLSLAEVQVMGHTSKHFKIYLNFYLVFFCTEIRFIGKRKKENPFILLLQLVLNSLKDTLIINFQKHQKYVIR